MKFDTTTRNKYILFLSLTLIFGATIYRDAIAEVFKAVLNREDSSHGVFVPVFSAYFLWLDRHELLKQGRWSAAGAAIGAILLGLSIIPDKAVQVTFILYVLLVAAAALALFGIERFRILGFPILFLIMMTPLPDDVYTQISDISRTITFSGSLYFLTALDVPFYRDGWLLQLPNALLEVAISCSGIRYLLSFFVFSIAYSYLFRKTVLGRSLVVLMSIPISIAASTFRLAIIFILAYFISPRLADHGPHILISWINFGTILFSLIAMDQYYLRKNRKNRPIQSKTVDNVIHHS